MPSCSTHGHYKLALWSLAKLLCFLAWTPICDLLKRARACSVTQRGGSKPSVTKTRFSTFWRSPKTHLISFKIVWSFRKCASSNKNMNRSMRYEAFCMAFNKTVKNSISTLVASFSPFSYNLAYYFTLPVFHNEILNRFCNQNLNIVLFGCVRCASVDPTLWNLVKSGKSFHYSAYYWQWGPIVCLWYL